MDDLDEDDEPAPTAAQVWQQGQAEASHGLFLHLVGRGMTQVQLLSKNLLTREALWLQVAA